jgi:predicted nucleic acid-binding Zn ribbon protein
MNSALRALVVTEWRGLPEGKLRPDKWQRLGDVMPKLVQQLGLSDRLKENEITNAWRQIVGDFIAAHSAPVTLRDGVLVVRVVQPALHYQFETISKPEILRRLKQRFGSKLIRDLRFRVG